MSSRNKSPTANRCRLIQRPAPLTQNPMLHAVTSYASFSFSFPQLCFFSISNVKKQFPKMFFKFSYHPSFFLEASTLNHYSASVSSYPLQSFFCSKAAKKSISAPIWARLIRGTLINISHMVDKNKPFKN